jgi:hypothetical protein
MKKHQKLILVLVSAVILVMISNRWVFGIWNPFSKPDRIECFGRRYYISNLDPISMSESERPEYPISTWVWAGKSLYMSEAKGDLVPVLIYLKLTDGKYQIYALSGSN